MALQSVAGAEEQISLPKYGSLNVIYPKKPPFRIADSIYFSTSFTETGLLGD
jgi:hypothetical protein